MTWKELQSSIEALTEEQKNDNVVIYDKIKDSFHLVNCLKTAKNINELKDKQVFLYF